MHLKLADERTLARHPLPIADSLYVLDRSASDSVAAIRLGGVTRAVLCLLGTIALASRDRWGTGPHDQGRPVGEKELLRPFDGSPMDDARWLECITAVLGPWLGHPAPELIEALATVMTDPRLDSRSIAKVVSRRPFDERLATVHQILDCLEPMWVRFRVVVPTPWKRDGCQVALLAMGPSGPGSDWSRTTLEKGVSLAPWRPALVDEDDEPVLELHPYLLFLRPCPEDGEEMFFLDRASEGVPIYRSVNSGAEYRAKGPVPLFTTLMAAQAVPAPVDPLQRPFRGLLPFEAKHHRMYFGRETQAQSVANRVRRYATVTVTGPSGTGKSSFLAAGVVPLLDDLDVAELRPGVDPAAALVESVGTAIGAELSKPGLLAQLRSDPEAFVKTLGEWSAATGRTLVIVVDHIEELFAPGLDPSIAQPFNRVLGVIADGRWSGLRLVMAVREDYFGRLGTVDRLNGHYNRHVEVLVEPDVGSLVRTITEPVARQGYRFEDAELVSQMVAAVRGEPASLALLQFCCDRMWDERDEGKRVLTRASYNQVGGVGGVIERWAEKLMQGLDAGEQRAAQRLLLALVSSTGMTRAMEKGAVINGPEMARVVKWLLRGGLLVERPVGPEGDLYLEIVHNCAVRHWSRMRQWVDQRRGGQHLWQLLEQSTNAWDAAGRPESMLWDGDLLDEYRVWRRHTVLPVGEAEAAFGAASELRTTRRGRLRRDIVVGVVFIAILVAGVTWVRGQEAKRRSLIAEAEAAQALRDVDSASLARVTAEAGLREAEGRFDHAVALSRSAVSMEQAQMPGPGLTPALAQLASLGSRSVLARVLKGHRATVRQLNFAPGGTLMASSDAAGEVWIWDVSAGVAHRIAQLPPPVRAMEFSDSDDMLALISDRDVWLWQGAVDVEPRRLSGHLDPTAVRFTPDGTGLVTADRSGQVRLWDPARAELLAEIDNGATVTSLALDSDGLRLATGSSEGLVRVWDLVSGTLVDDLEGQQGPSLAAWSSDGTLLYTAGSDPLIRLWEPTSGSQVLEFEGSISGVNSLVFASGRLVAQAGDGTLLLWDRPGSADPVRLDPGDTSSRPSVERGGHVFAQAVGDTVEVRDVRTGVLVQRLLGHRGPVHATTVSPDGRYVASAGVRGDVRVWQRHAGALERSWRAHDNARVVAVSPNGLQVVTAGEDHHATLWDAATGRTVAVMKGHRAPVHTVVFSPDGRFIATGSDDGAIRVWDAGTGALFEKFEERWAIPGAIGFQYGDVVNLDLFSAWHGVPRAPLSVGSAETFTPSAASTSSDGKRVALVERDGRVRVWNSISGELVMEVPGQWATARVRPDGEALATGAADGRIAIWGMKTGEEVYTIEVHSGEVTALAFSEDSQLLLAGSIDGGVVALDVPTGLIFSRTEGHEGAVNAVSFASNGLGAMTVGVDGTIRHWNVSIPDPKDLVAETGAMSNLRLCRDTSTVVAVLPFPRDGAVYAPEAACRPGLNVGRSGW